jgi:transposase
VPQPRREEQGRRQPRGNCRRPGAAVEERRQEPRRQQGIRRFLKNPEDEGFAFDRARVEEDAKFDGVFVLRSNADLSPLEAMLVYKQLWTVERTFRTATSLLGTRPIYHQLDETIRGYVACSFLALVLKKELEDRLAAAN